MYSAGTPAPVPVSIGLPVHNGERYLEAAIESILGQSFGDLELVISDNASTDATGEICRDLASRDPRIRYERQPVNVGARRNFEIVHDRARGELFKWSGHDDVLHPKFVARCVERLEADDATVLCATDICVIDGDGDQMGWIRRPITAEGDTPHERLRQFFAHERVHQTIFGVIRRSALDATGLFGPWFASDRALLMELALLGRLARVDETLFFHREHAGRPDYLESPTAWYVPEQAGRPVVDHWRHVGRSMRMVAAVPMSPAERVRCLLEYGRHFRTLAPRWLPILWREARTALRAHTPVPLP